MLLSQDKHFNVKIIVVKEKLEIVSGAAPPPFQILAGGFPRHHRRRNAFELFLEHSTQICRIRLILPSLLPVSKRMNLSKTAIINSVRVCLTAYFIIDTLLS